MVSVTSKRIKVDGQEFWEVSVSFEGSRELQELYFHGNMKIEFIEDEYKLRKGLKILFLGEGYCSLEVLYPPEIIENLIIEKKGDRVFYRSIELPKREGLPSKEELTKLYLLHLE